MVDHDFGRRGVKNTAHGPAGTIENMANPRYHMAGKLLVSWLLKLNSVVIGTVVLSGAASAQVSPPVRTPSASAIGESATIIPPPEARVLKSPMFVVKRTGPDATVLGRWIYRAQLLVLADDGPFGGSLEHLGASARARFEADGGSIAAEHAVKICRGTQDGWYMEGTFDALNRAFHDEAVLALGGAEAYRATYSRQTKFVELPAAHDAILTLCVPHS